MCRAGFERQHSLPSSEYLGADGGLYQVCGEDTLGKGGGWSLRLGPEAPRVHSGQGCRAVALPLARAQGPSQAGTPAGSLSSQIPPQPRRAAPDTPPPPVKRRDREALMAPGSGEKAGLGQFGGGRAPCAWHGCSARVRKLGPLGLAGWVWQRNQALSWEGRGSGPGGVRDPGGCPSTACTLCPQVAATPRPPGPVLCPVAPQSAAPPLTRSAPALARLSWAPAAHPRPRPCPAEAPIPLCPKLSPLPPRCQPPSPLQRRWRWIQPQPLMGWRPWVH